MSGLNARQRLFVQEYLIDLNATQAAIRAGYSAKTAHVIGHENLKKPEIAAAVAEAQVKRVQRVAASGDMVVQELLAIATADPRELVEYRRNCCRYCWGEGNRYQRTAGEMERDREDWERRNTELIEAGKPGLGDFNEKGGIGYTPKKKPNPDCSECFGDGVGETFIHDTRNLSPQAARLYAGIKETKDGFEAKMLSQDAAIVNLGRHFGSFNDKLQVDANVRGTVAYKANIPSRT